MFLLIIIIIILVVWPAAAEAVAGRARGGGLRGAAIIRTHIHMYSLGFRV